MLNSTRGRSGKVRTRNWPLDRVSGGGRHRGPEQRCFHGVGGSAGAGSGGKRSESHQVWTTLQGISEKKSKAQLGREAGVRCLGFFPQDGN